MKKGMKKFLIGLIIFVVVAIALLALWVFLIYPKFVRNSDNHSSVDLAKFAKNTPHVELDKKSGMMYIDNEIVVISSEYASATDISSVAAGIGASVDSSMADIGIYKFNFGTPKSSDELNTILENVKNNPYVDDAYLNLVIVEDEDSSLSATGWKPGFLQDAGAPADPSSTISRVYPSDEWDGSSWNAKVPSGANWGMEAIDAPGAWYYINQISPVNIGLIDTMPDKAHADLELAGSTRYFIDVNTGDTAVNTYNITAGDHGTHVSGIMAAKWNNGVGVSGVVGGKGTLYHSAAYYVNNGDVSMGYGTSYSYLLCLKALIDQDVRVINISQNTNRLIGFAASHGNKNAINYLTTQAKLTERGLLRIINSRTVSGKSDFVICVAAGNSNNTYYYKDRSATYGYTDKMKVGDMIAAGFGSEGEKGGSQALYNNFLNLMTEPAVMDRVVVVGAVGIDYANSTSEATFYKYSDYSNIGARVDIVAPGDDIYSTIPGGYEYFDGTSMATPHVAGVLGLIFGANPELSGPDAKTILLASTTGRYYYQEGSSGLVNARIAVIKALQTRTQSVGKVVGTSANNGIDLCFVIDTTGSMEDDIDSARRSMKEILSHLGEKSSDYRVALIDYRDYSDRTGSSADYPAKIQLDFSSNDEVITEAINNLNLGYGGDLPETVYSGLMTAVALDWRASSRKVIIILGDAAPLDPEPYTGYTLDDVLYSLYTAGISVDYDSSDSRVIGAPEDSMITVYSIGTGSSAADFFDEVAETTGGLYTGLSSADLVGDTIVSSIDQIVVSSAVDTTANFGSDGADSDIDLYVGDGYLYTFHTDKRGRIDLQSIEPGEYTWVNRSSMARGTLVVKSEDASSSVKTKKSYWFSPLLSYWNTHKKLVIIIAVCSVLFFMLLPLLISGLKKLFADGSKKEKAPKEPKPPKETKPPKAPKEPAAPNAPTGYYRPVQQPAQQYGQPMQQQYGQPMQQQYGQPMQQQYGQPMQQQYGQPMQRPMQQPVQQPVQATPELEKTVAYNNGYAAPAAQVPTAAPVMPAAPAAPAAPAQQAAETKRFCKYCGAKLIPGDMFCPNCGNRLG